MEARVYKLEKAIVLELQGRVDSFHAPLVKSELQSYISSGKSRLAIDLTKVTYLDPKCLRDWVELHFLIIKQKTGGGIALVKPTGKPEEIIAECSLNTIMPILNVAGEILNCVFPTIKNSEHDKKVGFRNTIKDILNKLSFGIFMIIFAINNIAMATDVQPIVSLSLSDAHKMARERSPLIKLSRARFTEKDASFEIARKSQLPKFTSTVGYLYQSNPNALTDLINKEATSLRSGGDTQSINELQTRNQVKFDKNLFVVGIGAVQIIYAGGYFQAKQSLADSEKELSDIEVRLSEIELDTLVRDAFLGILLLEKKLDLEKQKKETLTIKLAATKMAVVTNSLPKATADQAELELLVAEREVDNSTAEIAVLREQFNLLVGLPPEQVVKLSIETETNTESYKSKQPFEAALARNPTIAQALKRLSMAESYISIVRSQEMFVPKVFGFGGVDHTQGIGNNARFLNWSAGLGIVIPIIDGGVQNQETRKALALRSQAELSYQIDESKLRQSVSQALRKRSQAISDQQLAKKAVLLTSKSVLEAQNAVESKQIPKYQLEEIKVRHLESQLKMLAAEAEYARWDSVLYNLTGSQK